MGFTAFYSYSGIEKMEIYHTIKRPFTIMGIKDDSIDEES